MSEKPRELTWVGKTQNVVRKNWSSEENIEFVEKSAFEQLRAERDELLRTSDKYFFAQAAKREAAEKKALSLQEQVDKFVGYKNIQVIEKERDQLRSKLAVAREALKSYAGMPMRTSDGSKFSYDSNSFENDRGNQAREALKKLTDEEKK